MKVLIVDDEISQRTGLAAMVSAWGMTAETAAEGGEALEKLQNFAADVILTDLNMPGLDGFGFLEKLREQADMPPTIVLTAFGNIETAVRTVHELGAYWFLEKPIQPKTLEVLVRRAGSHAELRVQKRNLERQLVYKGSLGELVGRSSMMQEIFALLQQAGPSKACVLITGESGTGKELVARTVHALSPRRQGPFIAINCAALPETLLESELFGHEKGAFTGAHSQRIGRFEQCHQGTLFLDEIGDMSLATQTRMLRVLQSGTFERVGGNQTLHADVRVIAATNQPLEQAVVERRFREDLFYRLNVVRVSLPPLRERRSDIRLLVSYFLKRIAHHQRAKPMAVSEEVLEALDHYHWPGNVRELENAIRRATVVAKGDTLLLEDLPPELRSPSPRSQSAATPPPFPTAEPNRNPPGPDPQTVAVAGPKDETPDLAGMAARLFQWARQDPRLKILPAVERELVRNALRETRGNQVQAARLLGINRATLRKRMEKFGIRSELTFQ